MNTITVANTIEDTNGIQFIRCTQAQYDNLAETQSLDENALYFILDGGCHYLGSLKMSTSESQPLMWEDAVIESAILGLAKLGEMKLGVE